jgi:hypothetical protein
MFHYQHRYRGSSLRSKTRLFELEITLNGKTGSLQFLTRRRQQKTQAESGNKGKGKKP